MFKLSAASSTLASSSGGRVKVMATWLPFMRLVLAGAAAGLVAVASGAALMKASALLAAGRRVMLPIFDVLLMLF